VSSKSRRSFSCGAWGEGALHCICYRGPPATSASGRKGGAVAMCRARQEGWSQAPHGGAGVRGERERGWGSQEEGAASALQGRGPIACFAIVIDSHQLGCSLACSLLSRMVPSQPSETAPHHRSRGQRSRRAATKAIKPKSPKAPKPKSQKSQNKP
jgi:hypothetical protein